MAEDFRFPDAKRISVTISRQADKWFASISVEMVALQVVPWNDRSGFMVIFFLFRNLEGFECFLA